MTDSAVIGYIHPGVVRAEFCRSMLNTVVAQRDRVEAVISLQSGPLLASARNDLVAMFLADHTAPWLLMVDTDMVFAPDALSRLVDAADERERPIVGGLCYSAADGTPRPTIYELVEEGDSAAFATYTVWPEDDVMPVGATGAAFLLIHRTVFKQVAEGWASGKRDTVFPWFRETTMGRRRVGEDMTFCLRARSAGFPIHVHTGIQVGHIKSTMLGKVC